MRQYYSTVRLMILHLSGLDLWLLQSCLDFHHCLYIDYHSEQIPDLHFSVSNAFFVLLQVFLLGFSLMLAVENRLKIYPDVRRPCRQGCTICQKKLSSYKHLFANIVQTIVDLDQLAFPSQLT